MYVTSIILLARILASSLLMRFTQDIGLKSSRLAAVGFLGTSVIQVWFTDWKERLPLEKFSHANQDVRS